MIEHRRPPYVDRTWESPCLETQTSEVSAVISVKVDLDFTYFPQEDGAKVERLLQAVQDLVSQS